MAGAYPRPFKHVRDEHSPHVRRNKNSASFRETTSSETEPPRSSARLAGEDAVTVITLEPYFWCLRCAYFQNPGRRIKAPLKRFLSGVQKTT